eukprot:s419_g38.t1
MDIHGLFWPHERLSYILGVGRDNFDCLESVTWHGVATNLADKSTGFPENRGPSQLGRATAGQLDGTLTIALLAEFQGRGNIPQAEVSIHDVPGGEGDAKPDRLRRVAHKLFNAVFCRVWHLSSMSGRPPRPMASSSWDPGATLNPFFRAVSRFRQRRWDECIDICTELLEQILANLSLLFSALNPKDQAAWFLKCRALTSKQWIDDVEIDEEGVADLLLDENAAPRPGTSLNRPLTRAESGGGPTQVVRPVSASGRPLTGFARPGTNRPTSSSAGRDVTTAMQGNRPGTSRPLTSMGRLIRLGHHVVKLSRSQQSVPTSKELASEAAQAVDFKDRPIGSDWWWKARLGKAYYQLGLLRDAEKQFKSALKDEEMITTHLELCKVYLRLDQPNSALDQYGRAAEKFVGETHILIGLARTYDMLNALLRGVSFYKTLGLGLTDLP